METISTFVLQLYFNAPAFPLADGCDEVDSKPGPLQTKGSGTRIVPLVKGAPPANVAPNLDQIKACARANAELGHLFRTLRRFLLTGKTLDFFRVELSGRSAVQAFPYVLAKVLHFQGSQLILLLQKAERFADDLARGVIEIPRRSSRGSSLQGGE